MSKNNVAHARPTESFWVRNKKSGGYLLKKMNIVERVLAVVGGLLLVIPGTVTDIIGIVLTLIVLALQFLGKKREAKA